MGRRKIFKEVNASRFLLMAAEALPKSGPVHFPQEQLRDGGHDHLAFPQLLTGYLSQEHTPGKMAVLKQHLRFIYKLDGIGMRLDSQ
jgi:hypothetical protein